jgi:Mn2+/Fe2+ NRAMP family transporter
MQETIFDIIIPLLITAMCMCFGAAICLACTSTKGDADDYGRRLHRNVIIGALAGAIFFLAIFIFSINNPGGLY